MNNSESDSETASPFTSSTLLISYILVSGFLILSILFIGLYITPQYVEVYDDMDTALPMATKIVIQSSSYAISLASGTGILLLFGGIAGYKFPKLLPVFTLILICACFVLFSLTMIALNLPLVDLVQNIQ